MTRVSTLTLLIALGLSASAYAQAPAIAGVRKNANPPAVATQPAAQAGKSDLQNIHQDFKTLETDDDEIRALDRKRDEALRSKNPAAAQQIQAQIDKLRAVRKNLRQDIRKDEADTERQKRAAEEKCARDPVCAAKKKHEAMESQLQAYKQRLASDESAAARISQDKGEIAKLEDELKK